MTTPMTTPIHSFPAEQAPYFKGVKACINSEHVAYSHNIDTVSTFTLICNYWQFQMSSITCQVTRMYMYKYTAVADAVLAKFKAKSFLSTKDIPLFCYYYM